MKWFYSFNQLNFIQKLIFYFFIFFLQPLLGAASSDSNNFRRSISVNSSWPSSGSIEFRSVSLSYRPNLPPALRSFSVSIPAGARIGVVGRSGAGKSSIFQSLFRIRNYSGQILVGGVDISRLPLSLLRSRLSIIPQTPVLVSGSLRSNLDFHGVHSDQEIFQVLSRVGLFNRVAGLFRGLSTEVSDYEGRGENFSVGEKQLFCFARAILSNCAIICMDEAAASLDSESAKSLDQAIRSLKDSTIIFIAHRISSVVSMDKIISMESGKIVEFDSPSNLLRQETSLFKKLLNQENRTEEILDENVQ